LLAANGTQWRNDVTTAEKGKETTMCQQGSSDSADELMPNSSSQGALRYSGSYALNDSDKTLTLRVEESSLPNRRGATQTGTIKFVISDHLGWTNSVPLVASADFTSTELIWTRTKVSA
jgi:hypothetical protein